jgi:hypothetical protein
MNAEAVKELLMMLASRAFLYIPLQLSSGVSQRRRGTTNEPTLFPPASIRPAWAT